MTPWEGSRHAELLAAGERGAGRQGARGGRTRWYYANERMFGKEEKSYLFLSEHSLAHFRSSRASPVKARPRATEETMRTALLNLALALILPVTAVQAAGPFISPMAVVLQPVQTVSVTVETPTGPMMTTRPSSVPEEVFLTAYNEFVASHGYSPLSSLDVEPGGYTCPDEIFPGLGPTAGDQLLTNACTVRSSFFTYGESYPWIFYMNRGLDLRPTKGLIVEGQMDRLDGVVDYAWPADRDMHFYNLFCDGIWMLVEPWSTGICLRAWQFKNDQGDLVYNMGSDNACAQTPRPACWPY